MRPNVECGKFGRWIIVHPLEPWLAWSGSRWVPHNHGIPVTSVQVSNFETQEEAFETAAEQIGDVPGSRAH